MIELTEYQKLRFDTAVQFGAALVSHGDYAPVDCASEAALFSDALLDELGIVDPDQIPV